MGRVQGEGEGRVEAPGRLQASGDWMEVQGVVCRRDMALYVAKWRSSRQERQRLERGGQGRPESTSKRAEDAARGNTSTEAR